jgi:anti-sigma B factor antagonist
LGLDPAWQLYQEEGRLMFDVELSVDGLGGRAIVALYGELRVADAPGLASHLITAVAACGPSIIVDLSGLELIDSCGLRVLVRVLTWTRESGGDMALAAPQPQVRQVLSVTGLIDDFSFYSSVEQAASGTRPHVSAAFHSGPRPRGHHRGERGHEGGAHEALPEWPPAELARPDP